MFGMLRAYSGACTKQEWFDDPVWGALAGMTGKGYIRAGRVIHESCPTLGPYRGHVCEAVRNINIVLSLVMLPLLVLGLG
eukprot:873337-Pelagomonas_calceolata.AAC.8